MEIDVLPDKIEKEIVVTLQQAQLLMASAQEVISDLSKLVEQIKREGLIVKMGGAK